MKKIFSMLLATLLICINMQPVLAASETICNGYDAATTWTVITSEETKSIITDNIDFNEIGKQIIYLGRNIAFEYTSSESENVSTRAFSVKSGTMSGRFYLTDSDQTVARYSLAVTFRYNGSSVYANDEDIQVSYSAIPDWSVNGTYSKSSGYGWISVDASYQLYHNGNYNNDTFLDMSCDAHGNITKNYE